MKKRNLIYEMFLSSIHIAVTFSEQAIMMAIAATVLSIGLSALWWMNAHDVVREIATVLVRVCGEARPCSFPQLYTAFGFSIMFVSAAAVMLVFSIPVGLGLSRDNAEDVELSELRELIWAMRVDQKRIADYLGDADIQVVDTGVMDYERLQAD